MAETETPHTRASGVGRVVSSARAAVAYALFVLGVLAFWSFFAPFLDAPALAWYAPVLPEILAPTEGDAVIDVSPLIAGVVVSVVAVWLR